MPSDAKQKPASFEEQVKEFKGFTTREGEILDPKDENLNPTKQDISEAERIAGTKTVKEAAAEATDDAKDKAVSGDSGVVEAGPDGKDGSGDSELSESDEGKEGDAGKEDSDDEKMISVAEAKKQAAHAAKKRIGEMTKANSKLRVSLESALTRLDALESRLTAVPKTTTDVKDDGAPDPDKFDLGELDTKYIKALARYESRQASLEMQREEETKRQREAATRQQREFATKKEALAEAGSAEYDDFNEVVLEGAKWSLQNQDAPEAWPLSATVGELAFESKAGHKVLYHLATHPDEARKVFALSPGAQGAWFARKELELAPPPASGASGKPQIKTSNAPTPPKYKARGGNGTNPVPTDSQDFAAVEAAWRTGSQRRPN